MWPDEVFSRRAAWRVICMPLLIVAGCAPPTGQDQVPTLADEEMAAFFREVHPLIEEIPTIPIPDYLQGRDDPGAGQALNTLEQVNSFADLAASDFGHLAKPAGRSQAAGGWQRECFDFPRPACLFTRSTGDFTITVWHEDFGDGWVWWESWDGCDGTHEYHGFLVQRHFLWKNLRKAIWEVYQYPDPPSCGGAADGTGPGLSVVYSFEAEGDGTLYTPWGESDLTLRRYTTTVFRYHPVAGAYLPYAEFQCTAYPDDRTVYESWAERLSVPGSLYLAYRGTWSDLRYCWESFQEDGSLWGCGGDAGCPDCGP